MDFIKKQLEQIKEHLGSLSTSQSLVIFLLVVMIMVALFWTIYQTSKPPMVPLLDQPLTETEAASYENKLENWDVTYRIENNKILVKRQDRDRLIARLGQVNALPADMSESWKKLITESDMWITQEDRQNRWKLALEQRLGQIIQLMDSVQKAYVIINPGSKRILSDGPSSDPSASVYMHMQSGITPSKPLVVAVAICLLPVDRLRRFVRSSQRRPLSSPQRLFPLRIRSTRHPTRLRNTLFRQNPASPRHQQRSGRGLCRT